MGIGVALVIKSLVTVRTPKLSSAISMAFITRFPSSLSDGVEVDRGLGHITYATYPVLLGRRCGQAVWDSYVVNPAPSSVEPNSSVLPAVGTAVRSSSTCLSPAESEAR